MGARVCDVVEDCVDGVEFILVELLIVHDILCVCCDCGFIGRNFALCSGKSSTDAIKCIKSAFGRRDRGLIGSKPAFGAIEPNLSGSDRALHGG